MKSEDKKNARTCLVAGFDWKRQIKMNKERVGGDDR